MVLNFDLTIKDLNKGQIHNLKIQGNEGDYYRILGIVNESFAEVKYITHEIYADFLNDEGRSRFTKLSK